LCIIGIGDEPGAQDVPDPIWPIGMTLVALAPTRMLTSLPDITNNGPILIAPMPDMSPASVVVGVSLAVAFPGAGVAGISIPGISCRAGFSTGSGEASGEGAGEGAGVASGLGIPGMSFISSFLGVGWGFAGSGCGGASFGGTSDLGFAGVGFGLLCFSCCANTTDPPESIANVMTITAHKISLYFDKE
jgi:hypothetical protein